MTQTAPEGDHRIQLQSGPLLISAGRPERLRMKQDEATRRVFVAIDEEQRVIFGVVYHTEEVFKGPILSDLPEIINLFSQKTGIKLVSAMNLDGGSASVFADENIFLGELSNVGSFFCVVQK